MAYGTVKVDTIIFDQGGADQNVTVSGIYRAITSGVTVSGTISGAVLVGTTTVSGATVTGTTANFVSGVFTTVVSGATVTGTQSSFTSGNFVTLSGATATFTSAVIASGTAAAPSLSIISDPNTGIYSPGADQLAVATNGSGRLFVTSAGLIGVGQSSPGSALDVDGEIRIYPSSGAGNLRFGSGGVEKGKVAVDASSNYTVETAGSERLRITSAGLVGIGTSAPGTLTHLRGTNATTNFTINNPSGLFTLQDTSSSAGAGAKIAFGASYDGTNSLGQAIIGASKESGTGSGADQYRSSLVFHTSNYASGVRETMRLDPDGRLGIGTTSPVALLQVGAGNPGATTAKAVINTNNVSGGGLIVSNWTGGATTNGPRISFDNSNHGNFDIGGGNGSHTFVIRDNIASSDRVTITSAGNVGIGTTGPNNKLEIAGTTANVGLDGTSNTYINFLKSAANIGYVGDANWTFSGSSSDFGVRATSNLVFGIGANEHARIDSSGRLLVGTSSYDGNARAIIQGNTSSNTTGALAVRYNGARPTSAGESIGAIRFESTSNTSSNYHYASINCDTDGTSSSDTDIPGRLVFSTTADGASTPTERMRITSAGNVGIGTTSPGQALEVSGSGVFTGGVAGQGAIIGRDGGTGGATYGCQSGDVLITAGNTNIRFTTNANERARIDSSGRLLVGTSTARSIATQSLAIQNEGTSFGTTGFSTCRNSNDIYGPYIHFGKTRGASVGSNTIVASGDDLGGLIFGGADGTDVDSQAAYIICQVDGTPGANDMPGRLVFSTTADGASIPTERMRIDALGALKTSPNGTYKFPAGTTEITHNDATSSVQLTASSTGFTGDAVTISTYRNTVNDSYKFLSCIRQGFAVALEIRDDGDVYNVNGTYGSLSDVKLKENIVDANSQWDDIRRLRVRNYNFKPETNNSTHKQIGVIAQEIEDVSPGLVNTVPDRDEDGNDLGTVTKSVNYSVLYMKAVKALQEAMTRIETLEADVALLKSA